MGIITGNTSSVFGTQSQRERHIVDFVRGTVKASEEETAPSRNEWKSNELLFAGIQDWSADGTKEEWQSKLFIHEYAPIIRDAAVAAQTQIFSRSDFVNLVAPDSVNEEFREILNKLVRYYLEEIGFAQLFYEWCLCGGIYGHATWKLAAVNKTVIRPEIVVEMVQKAEAKAAARVNAANKETFMMPNSLQEVEAGLQEAMKNIFGSPEQTARREIKSKKNLEIGLELSVVNPHNFFWAPDIADINLSPWHAEKYFLPFASVVGLFDAGVLNKKKKDQLLKHASKHPDYSSSSVDSFAQQKLRQRQQFSTSNSYWPMVEVIEYFGPILSDVGEPIDENQHVILLNGKYVGKDAINGYWDQKSPYRTAVFNRRPFKPGGAGIADAAVNSQKLINQLVSLFVDSLRMDIMAPIGVNRDMLVDQSQADAGFAPGEVIQLMNGKASDAFSEFPKTTNNTAPELFQTIEMLKMAGQKGSSINTMTSNPSSRARISSAEIRSNDNRRAENLNSLGFEIDANGIQPLVERLVLLVIQFSFTNNNINLLASRGILSESERDIVINMTSFQRFEEAMKHIRVEVRGFRAAIEREQYLARLGEASQQINQMPPHVHEMIDWREWLRAIFDGYSLPSSKLIRQRDERDRAREENVLLRDDQFVATLPKDDDGAHLGIHFEQLQKMGPVQSLIQHCQMHLRGAQTKGMNLPPPPPEIAQMLGLPPPPSKDTIEQEKNSAQLVGNRPLGLNGPLQ